VGTRGAIVGRVIEVGTHPDGDHIWLASVDLGKDFKVQIVWGGEPIVEAGDLVPVAPPGSRVHGKKMRRRNYRGQSSFGMLCSLAELGWDPDITHRVAILDPHAPLSPGDSLDEHADKWREIVRDKTVAPTRSGTFMVSATHAENHPLVATPLSVG
jgi:tRNA-binding EMAP/Myf-like protein